MKTGAAGNLWGTCYGWTGNRIMIYDDVMTWKYVPYSWPFLGGIDWCPLCGESTGNRRVRVMQHFGVSFDDVIQYKLLNRKFETGQCTHVTSLLYISKNIHYVGNLMMCIDQSVSSWRLEMQPPAESTDTIELKRKCYLDEFSLVALQPVMKIPSKWRHFCACEWHLKSHEWHNALQQ